MLFELEMEASRADEMGMMGGRGGIGLTMG